MEPLAPIPTSPAQRWREFRIRTLPVLTFFGVLACVVLLWREFVIPTSVLGEVEGTRALIITAVPGTIKEIKVQRFQRVKAGDEIAIVSPMESGLPARALEDDLTTLKSPIDGVVTMVNYQPGAKVLPNMPIAVISAVQAHRIIGYVRKPYSCIPKPDDTVQIRHQTVQCETAPGTVLDVPGQFELISATLLPPLRLSAPAARGLPVAVPIPPDLSLLPAEAIDLILDKR
jgi:hypothetical protein